MRAESRQTRRQTELQQAGWGELIGGEKKKTNYLAPGRLQSAGSLIAESTGMTSSEHGVLASTDPACWSSASQDETIKRLGRCFFSGRCVRAPVRSSASPSSFQRCADARLGARRRGSLLLLSFCLDLKRQGPVFIKVGVSPPPLKKKEKTRKLADSRAMPPPISNGVFAITTPIL